MAIPKQRLEELIEQGATIWKVPYGTSIETTLHKYSYVCNKLNLKEDYLMEYIPNEGVYVMAGVLSKLFENFEDAKWEEEFGNITRTEKLELPTWEEFKQDPYFELVDSKGIIWFVGIAYEQDNKLLRVCNIPKSYDFKPTKEGYILACRKCKELFLGMVVEDVKNS